MCNSFFKFANKIIMFQEAQFKGAIILCYNMQNNIIISGKVSPFLIWHINQINMDLLCPIMNAQCVLNQFGNHQLLCDTL
jgi:hypothetical protein